MLDADISNQLKEASIEERIRIIEMILRSLKQDLRASKVQSVATQRPLRGTVRHYEEPYDSAARPQRPAFGFMKDTGTILGDVVSPVLPESDWEVLQ